MSDNKLIIEPLVVGPNAGAGYGATGCVAIGDCAVASEPNELCVKVLGYEGRCIMTDEESEIVRRVLCRLNLEAVPPIVQ